MSEKSTSDKMDNKSAQRPTYKTSGKSYITPQWVKTNPFEAAARINELERENAVGLCCNGDRIWIVAYASNSIRRTSSPIQIEPTRKNKSSRRQFERAISACSSGEAHASRLRDSNGLAGDMERIKAVGNGQIPRVAELAWRTLIK